MCFVCDKNGNTFEMLKAFLREDTNISFKKFDNWQEIYLSHGNKYLTITADGDEGGYFHFKPEIPSPEELVPEEEILFKNLSHVKGSSKKWSLDPSLTVLKINKALPGVSHKTGSGTSDGGKVRNEWAFSYKGEECNIWDYKGSRWSAYGPRWVFDEIGLTVVGD